jgi:L-alanine-DL-glutamate epimerase-like enolase superfamily enzyme
MPVTAIVGYPPTIDAAAVASQVNSLWASGWRRFKMPMASSLDATVARVHAARNAAPDAWLGLDANMSFRDVSSAKALGSRLGGLNVGWLEDPVPPGDARLVADIRRAIRIPVAVGDEHGGSYYPQALLALDAVDVCRVDATTNGGVTRFRAILEMIVAAEKAYSPHMFPHVHSRILSGLGYLGSSIEWGIPGTDVHPMDDSLVQPMVRDGLMDPLPEELGFGALVDIGWVRAQEVRDPQGLLVDL